MNDKNHSLSEDIVEKLKESILKKKEFMPNEKLPNERLLAKHFGVGRSSIREAVKTLVASGILVAKQGSGTYVSPRPGIIPDPLGFDGITDANAMLNEWYQVRSVLEPFALELAVDAATEDEIDDIVKLAELEIDMIAEDDSEFLEVDRAFHLAIARAAHNIVMEKLIVSLQQSFYYKTDKFHLNEWNRKSKENAAKFHPRIAEFLKLRDKEGAMMAMRLHMLYGIKALE